eukprot:4543663-Pyramimonas_sp.AAC.2
MAEVGRVARPWLTDTGCSRQNVLYPSQSRAPGRDSGDSPYRLSLYCACGYHSKSVEISRKSASVRGIG